MPAATLLRWESVILPLSCLCSFPAALISLPFPRPTRCRRLQRAAAKRAGHDEKDDYDDESEVRAWGAPSQASSAMLAALNGRQPLCVSPATCLRFCALPGLHQRPLALDALFGPRCVCVQDEWYTDEEEEVSSPIDAIDPFIYFAGRDGSGVCSGRAPGLPCLGCPVLRAQACSARGHARPWQQHHASQPGLAALRCPTNTPPPLPPPPHPPTCRDAARAAGG